MVDITGKKALPSFHRASPCTRPILNSGASFTGGTSIFLVLSANFHENKHSLSTALISLVYAIAVGDSYCNLARLGKIS